MLGMIDMHCHIIPGVDDGAETKQDVERLLRMEYKSGVRTIVLTPHYRKGLFEAPGKEVLKNARYVQKKAEQMGLDMQICLGCEYHANSGMLEDLKREERFRINGGKYVLVEFSHRHSFQKIRNWIYELINEGYYPIVAHVERYPQVAKEVEKVEDLIELGALIQMDAGALLGEQGFKIKQIAKRLLKKDCVHMIASDAHNVEQCRPNLDLCAKYVTKKFGKEKALELFVENPRLILGK